MTTTVTVYSKPACGQCDATKRWLDKRGIKYVPLGLGDHPEKVEEFREQGLLAAPIVVIQTRDKTVTWSGFRATQLAELPHFLKENS